MAAHAQVTPKKTQHQIMPSDESIRERIKEQVQRRAYEIYQQRGGQGGSEMTDWLQAEAELLREAEEQG